MGFNKGFVEDSIISETGNWNVAQSYSEGIIMNQIRYIKQLQTVAEIGSIDPTEQPTNEDYIKFEALKRLVQALKQLISDTKFALKNNKDREKFDEHYKTVKTLRTGLNSVCETKYNQVRKTKTFVLKDKEFNNYIDVIDALKMELYKVINNSDLIYPTKEEFDPKAWKEAIIKRATTQG